MYLCEGLEHVHSAVVCCLHGSVCLLVKRRTGPHHWLPVVLAGFPHAWAVMLVQTHVSLMAVHELVAAFQYSASSGIVATAICIGDMYWH